MTVSAASTMAAVRAHVRDLPAGEPFTSSELTCLGTRAAVDQAVSRLVRSGAIERIARGVFARPRTNPYAGSVPPAPESLARAVARSSSSVLQVHGAQAAHEFGLTTQVPMRPIYLTSGRSRVLQAGGVTIELKHAADRRLLLADRPAGRAYAALTYLGKHEVSDATIESIRRQLPDDEFDALLKAAPLMPGWLSDVLYRFRAHVDGTLVAP